MSSSDPVPVAGEFDPVPVVHEVATPLGPARLHVHLPPEAPGAPGVPEVREVDSATPGTTRGTLVLGHGAGGGTEAPDLVAVTLAGTAAGWRVVLVEQPWRVAGKKVAPAPSRLDTGWLAALDGLAALDHGAALDQAAGSDGTATGPGAPLVVGGRSAGARGGCRTARAIGADGVVCLSFPLHPPGKPERSRAGELTGAGVPVLVVQGERDPFGRPDEVRAASAAGPSSPGASPGASAGAAEIEVVAVPGDHGLGRGAVDAGRAVGSWLATRFPAVVVGHPDGGARRR